MRNRFFSLVVSGILFVALCFSCALAESSGIELETMTIEMGNGSVSYPQIRNMTDENVMKLINNDLILSCGISSHIVTLGTLNSSVFGLNVDYREFHNNHLLSVVVNANGKQPDGRKGQSYIAVTYDLSTGKRITFDHLFHTPEEAKIVMEQLVEERLGSELSEYMEYAQIAPLPVENFYLDQSGITFYYPAQQLKYLSGFSGSCHFFYEEIETLLIPDENGIPAFIGILPGNYTDEEAQKELQLSVSEGYLPGVNAKLGDSMKQLIETGRLLREPDAFPGGRYFLLEAPEFRNIYLISDDMQDTYENSVLNGIQMRRGSFAGLFIGTSHREQWLRILGQPQETIPFTENMSYDYQLPTGQSDIYIMGEHELRLHSDENGILCSIQLNQ